MLILAVAVSGLINSWMLQRLEQYTEKAQHG